MIQKPQNAGFFKPQYFTKNVRYEVEFLDMIRGPKKYQLVASSGCAQACLNMPKVKTNSQCYFKNELSYEVSFFACGKKAIEVTLSIISSGSGQACSK